MPRKNNKKQPATGVFRPIDTSETTSPTSSDDGITASSPTISRRPSFISLSSGRDSGIGASIASEASSRVASALSASGKPRRLRKSSSSSSGFLTNSFTTHIKPDIQGHITPGTEIYRQAISVEIRDYIFQANSQRAVIKELCQRIKTGETTTIHASDPKAITSDKSPTVKIVLTDKFTMSAAESFKKTAYDAASIAGNVPHATGEAIFNLVTDVLPNPVSRLMKKGETTGKDADYEKNLNSLLRTNWRRSLTSKKQLIFTAKTHVSPSEAGIRTVYDTGKPVINFEEEMLHMMTHLVNHKSLPAAGSLTDTHAETMHRVLLTGATPSPTPSHDAIDEEDAPEAQRSICTVSV